MSPPILQWGGGPGLLFESILFLLNSSSEREGRADRGEGSTQIDEINSKAKNKRRWWWWLFVPRSTMVFFVGWRRWHTNIGKDGQRKWRGISYMKGPTNRWKAYFVLWRETLGIGPPQVSLTAACFGESFENRSTTFPRHRYLTVCVCVCVLGLRS